MSAPVPRPGILDIAPYVPGESKIEGYAETMKLSSNEGALGPSPKAIAAYNAVADELHRYPDGGSVELRHALGARFGLDPNRIVCGAGSDDVLSLVARTFAGPGDEILHSEHGFVMYPLFALSVGATPVAAPEADLTASVDNLLSKVTDRTRIVYLANPNNPTGSYISAEELARLRAGLREDIVLVVDAAYAEYVTRNDYSAGVELVDQGENTVMSRTFSKAFGLGGARLGWMYCPPVIADWLNRIRGPFNVALPAQAAGIAALEDTAFLAMSRDHNATWLPWLSDRLRDIGLTVFPSVANFVLVRFPETPGKDAKAGMKALSDRGVIARDVSSAGLPGCVRITIGREHEMRRVAETLREFMS